MRQRVAVPRGPQRRGGGAARAGGEKSRHERCEHTTRAVAAGFDLNWRRHEADRISMPIGAGNLFSVGYSFADPTVIG